MLPKEALAWMADLEKSIGNLGVSYGPVDIWPIIRNSLILAVLDESGKPWPTRKPILGRGKRFVRSLLSLIRADSTDVLFVTDTKYSECIEGKYYIKDVDGVAGTDECRGKSLKLAFSDEPDRPLHHDTSGAISFYALRIVSSALTKIVCRFPLPRQVSELVDVACDKYAVTGSRGVSRSVMRKRLKNNIIFAYFSAVFLRFLLKRVKPGKIFVHCYYSPFGMALCAAAKSHHIQITDVQHGLAGRNMRAYGQWHNSPIGGFSSLPSRFFSWIESDAQAINEWSEAVGLGKIAACTGQYWFRTLHETGLFSRAMREFRQFSEKLSKFQMVVVVTLQSPELDVLNLDQAYFYSEKICFLIRAHPNSVGYRLPESLVNLESSHSNVFVSIPTCMPIHCLMEMSDLNVTQWSASVYDASLSNCKSVVISAAGCDYFKDAGNSGDVDVVFSDDLETIIFERYIG